MAKKKDENAHLTIFDLMHGGAIRAIGSIKDCKIKQECAEMNFLGFQFTGEEYKKISKFIQDKEALTFIIIPNQAELFET